MDMDLPSPQYVLVDDLSPIAYIENKPSKLPSIDPIIKVVSDFKRSIEIDYEIIKNNKLSDIGEVNIWYEAELVKLNMKKQSKITEIDVYYTMQYNTKEQYYSIMNRYMREGICALSWWDMLRFVV